MVLLLEQSNSRRWVFFMFFLIAQMLQNQATHRMLSFKLYINLV